MIISDLFGKQIEEKGLSMGLESCGKDNVPKPLNFNYSCQALDPCFSSL